MSTPPTVPGYRPERPLGRGGHGEVWLGHDLATGRAVALKLLAGVAADCRTLRAEVAAAAGLAGPHVVSVRDIRIAGDDAVLVCDLAAGGSLADLLAARGRLAPAEAVTILAPLATVLAEAHARLLVHGDVSPANVLFTATGCPMLADWGLARVVAERAGGTGAGTSGFADPAVFDGEREADPAADVAGLAAVGYAALTGRPPWRPDRSRVALQRAVPLCPPRLAEAIEAALSVAPGERPAAGEFAAEVLRACDPQPVTLPRRPAAVAQPPRTVPRGPRPAAAAAPIPPDGRRPPSDGSRTGPSRRATVAVVVAVAGIGVAGALAGVVCSRGGSEAAVLPQARTAAHPVGDRDPTQPPTTATTPTGTATSGTAVSPQRPDWREVLQKLANRRAAALRQRDPGLLGRVYVAAAAARAADRSAIGRMRARGLVPQGLRIAVDSVRPLTFDSPDLRRSPRATVAVEMASTVSSYRLLDARTGRPVALAAARPREAIRVRLRRTADGWRIAALHPG